MAQQLTYEEYQALGLDAVTEAEYTPLEVYASQAIDAYCFRAISRLGLISDDYYGPIIRNAIAFQIAYVYQLGGIEAASGSDSSAGAKVASESENIGNYSHSVSYVNTGDSASRKASAYGIRIAPIAVSMLAPVRAAGRNIGGFSPC